MVYEKLPRQVKNQKIRFASSNRLQASTGILVTKTVPTAILATSKLIYEEARPIVDRLIREYILESTPRLVSSTGEANIRRGGAQYFVEGVIKCYKVGLVEGTDELTESRIQDKLNLIQSANIQ